MKPIKWKKNTNYTCHAISGNRIVAMIVQPMPPVGYGALAIETPVGNDTPTKILEEHSHKEIGQFKSLSVAKKASEKYVRAWLKKRRPGPKCKCRGIA